MSTLSDGQNVGRYRILRFLGAGAMGEVYLAEDPHIERQLAIKTVRLAGGRPQDIEDRKRRLLREARAAGRLLHPNVVTLFDAGEYEGLLYLAFEYVEGSDLASRIDADPAPTLREVLGIIAQVADALDYAHRQGIVHRDIKPGNILLDRVGKVKVADFGIAKVVGQNTELTVVGSVMGSPQYLSPEQIRGEELDGRSDIFSLGVVLYELLSGARPFDGETITTLVYQILNKEPQISSMRAVPLRLDQLLHHMLAKERDQRIATAGQVSEELAAIARELSEEVLSAPATAVTGAMDQTRILPSRGSALPANAVGAPPAAASSVPSGSPGLPPTLAPPLGPARGTAAPAFAPPPPPGSAPVVAPPPVASAAQFVAPPPPPPPLAMTSSTEPGSRRGAGIWIMLAAVLFLAAVAVAGAGYWAWTRYLRPAISGVQAAQPTESPASTATVTSPAATPTSVSGPSASPASAPEPVSQAPSPQTPENPAATNRQPAPEPAPAEPPPARTEPRRNPVPTPSSPPPRTRPTSGDATESPSRVPAPNTPSRAGSAARESDQPTPDSPRQVAPVAADKVLHTGLELAFRVTPADTFILLDGTVIGKAEEWSGEKKTRPYTLPGPGSYVIKLKHSGMDPVQLVVDATSARGVTQVVEQLRPEAAEKLDTSDLRTYRVRQGIALKVDPENALVLVDGKQRGMARQYPGHFGRSSELLLLDPGRHRVTIMSPGYARYDFAVEVFAGAESDHEKVEVVLPRGAAGS